LSFYCFLLDFLIKISYILVYQERDLYLSMIKIKQEFGRTQKENKMIGINWTDEQWIAYFRKRFRK